MAAIGPGTLVRCVKHATQRPYNEAVPIKGHVYTVRDVVEHVRGVGLRLVEVVNPPHAYAGEFTEASFAIEGFVPLDDSALSIFRAALTDTPAKEPVEA